MIPRTVAMDSENVMRVQRKKNFDTRFEIVLPATVGDCLGAVAEREMTSKSEYARRAIIKSLKRDGANLQPRQLETIS